MPSISCGSGNEVIVIRLGRCDMNLLVYFILFNIFISCDLNIVIKSIQLILAYFQSSASSVPQLWQPNNGAVMSNDLTDGKPAEESVACIALSKNDSYVMSASGGKVSLFNMMTFKVNLPQVSRIIRVVLIFWSLDSFLKFVKSYS